MARGDSGRIVLEINPSQKGELYSALTKDGLTLKNWFLKRAEEYLLNRTQLSLFSPSFVKEKPSPFHVAPKNGRAPKRPNRKVSGR